MDVIALVAVIIIYYAAIKKYTIIVQYFAMTFNHDYHAWLARPVCMRKTDQCNYQLHDFSIIHTSHLYF